VCYAFGDDGAFNGFAMVITSGSRTVAGCVAHGVCVFSGFATVITSSLSRSIVFR
jgi:hypothetical protein